MDRDLISPVSSRTGWPPQERGDRVLVGLADLQRDGRSIGGPAADEALGDRPQKAGQKAPAAEALLVAQRGDDVGLDRQADGDGRLLDGAALAPDAVGGDLIAAVALEVDVDVRDAVGVAAAHELEGAALVEHEGDATALLAQHGLERLGRHVVQDQPQGHRDVDGGVLEDGLLDQGQGLGVLLGRAGLIGWSLGRAGLEVVDPLGGDVGAGDGSADLGVGAPALVGHEIRHRPDGGGESGALGLAGLQGNGNVEVQGLVPALDHVGLVPLGGAEGQHRKAEHGRQVDGALQGRGQG